MATYYVYSGASGANDGTSWTNAWTSIVSLPSLADGDLVLVASDHSQLSLGAALTIGGTNNLSGLGADIISTNRTTGLYAAGAAIGFSSTIYSFNIYGGRRVAGFTVSGANVVGQGFGREMIMRGCTVNRALQNLQNRGHLLFEDGTVAAGSVQPLLNAGMLTIRRTTITTSTTAGTLVPNSGGHSHTRLEDCDLSGSHTHIWGGTTDSVALLRLIRCRLPTGFVGYEAAGPSALKSEMDIIIEACEVGAVTGSVTRAERAGYSGRSEVDTSVYRSGGASNGTTNFSLKLTALASKTATRQVGLRPQVLRRWLTGDGSTSKTLSIFLAHNAIGAGAGGALQSDQVWIEISGPPAAGGTVYAQGYGYSSRPTHGASASDLTTDGSSSWTGSGVGTKQKLTHTYTPEFGGVVEVRVYVSPGGGSDTVMHLDPVIGVT